MQQPADIPTAIDITIRELKRLTQDMNDDIRLASKEETAREGVDGHLIFADSSITIERKRPEEPQ